MKKIILSLLITFCTLITYGQFVETVADNNNTMTITWSDGKIDYVYKEGCKISNPTSGTVVYLIDFNKSTYPLDYSLVTSPVAASRAAMATTIQGYLDSFAYGTTGATGATGVTGATGATGATGTIGDTWTASTSAGVIIESANGTDVGLFGAGNTANATFYGGVNVTGAISAASVNGEYRDTITISNAELLALFTTPKTLIAAPGAGSYISLLSLDIYYDYATAPFANTGNNLQIRYQNAAGQQIGGNMMANGFLNQTADKVYQQSVLGLLYQVTATNIINQPIVLTYTTSNLTMGGGKLKVFVRYFIVTP